MLTSKADENYFGEGIEGTLTWDYQLSDVNAVASIDLPNDCPAALPEDLPLLQDASNVEKFVGVMEYQTASTPKDVEVFYQEQMLPLGWTQQENSLLSGLPDLSSLPQIPGMAGGSDNSGVLTFIQGKKTITITMELGETNTKVRIIVSNG